MTLRLASEIWDKWAPAGAGFLCFGDADIDGKVIDHGGELGTIVGNVTRPPADSPYYARQMSFNAPTTDARINFGSQLGSDFLSLQGSNSVIFAYKIKLDSLINFERIYDKSTSGSGTNGYSVTVESFGAGYGPRLYINGTALTQPANTSYVIDIWIEGALIYDSGKIIDGSNNLFEYYRLGTDTGSGSLSGVNIGSLPSFPNATANFSLGNWNHTTGRGWDGFIHHVGIANTLFGATNSSTLIAKLDEYFNDIRDRVVYAYAKDMFSGTGGAARGFDVFAPGDVTPLTGGGASISVGMMLGSTATKAASGIAQFEIGQALATTAIKSTSGIAQINTGQDLIATASKSAFGSINAQVGQIFSAYSSTIISGIASVLVGIKLAVSGNKSASGTVGMHTGMILNQIGLKSAVSSTQSVIGQVFSAGSLNVAIGAAKMFVGVLFNAAGLKSAQGAASFQAGQIQGAVGGKQTLGSASINAGQDLIAITAKGASGAIGTVTGAVVAAAGGIIQGASNVASIAVGIVIRARGATGSGAARVKETLLKGVYRYRRQLTGKIEDID